MIVFFVAVFFFALFFFAAFADVLLVVARDFFAALLRRAGAAFLAAFFAGFAFPLAALAAAGFAVLLVVAVDFLADEAAEVLEDFSECTANIAPCGSVA